MAALCLSIIRDRVGPSRQFAARLLLLEKDTYVGRSLPPLPILLDGSGKDGSVCLPS